MNSSPISRVEIYRQVRVVLVRHLIDIGRLTIQISMNHLRMNGSLCRLPGVTAALTAGTIQSIFSELGMIRGIKRVDGEFDNWRQVDEAGASWVPVETKKIIVAAARTPATTVFDVHDTGKPTPPA